MWPPCAGEGLERGCDFSRASARKQRSWDSNHSNFILNIWFLLHSFINSKCLLLSGIALKKKKSYYWQIWRQKKPCSSENNFLMARAVHRWDRPSNEVSSSPPLHSKGLGDCLHGGVISWRRWQALFLKIKRPSQSHNFMIPYPWLLFNNLPLEPKSYLFS